jgi:hypothetical protein
MFLGHFAIGFAGKKINAKPSLGTYFLAAQLLDLLWPSFLLLGIENVKITNDPGNPIPLSFTDYPVSHSLLTVLGWSLFFGVVYYLLNKNRKAALVLGFFVLSHWLLDLLVHIPDLPLYPGDSPHVGLGLWKWKYVELTIEVLMYVIGVALYLKATKAKSKAGAIITWSLIVFMFLIHLANIFGPPPPDVKTIAWAGQLQWLFVLWAYWEDSRRTALTT